MTTIPKQPPPPSVVYDAAKQTALSIVRNRAEEHLHRMQHDAEYREEQERIEAEEAEERTREERRDRRALLQASGCPPRLIERILNGELERTPAMQYSDKWLNTDPRPTFLVLSGLRGVGKTTGAASVVHRLRRTRWIRAGELAAIGLYDQQRFKPIVQAESLVIDDLGTEYNDAKGAFRSLFDLLINTRYDEMLSTIITTKLVDDVFEARYGAHNLDRIREAGLWVSCGNKGFR